MALFRIVFVLAVALLVPASSWSDVVVLDVVIESIDSAKSQITATRKTKTLQLDVSDNVTVIIKGRQSDLDSVGGKQPATVSYETTLRVVTKIEITDDPQPEMSLLVLKEICTSGNESGPWISADGLRLYWHVKNSQASWIWTAARNASTGVFSDARRLLPGADATLTADELQMVLLQDGKLYSTQRQSIIDDFERPSPVSDLAVFDLVAPCLSGDGLTLYADQGTEKSRRVCKIERSSRTSSWGEPKLLYGTEDHEIATPFVSLNGKLLFASTRGKPRVKLFKRSTASEPFAFAGYVGSNGTDANGLFPRYCSSTNELILATTPAGRLDRQIGIYTDFDPDTMVQRKDPEEAGLADFAGNWVAVREENDGKEMDRASFRKAGKKLFVSESRFLLSWSGKTNRGDFTVDEDAQPIAVDFKGERNGKKCDRRTT